MKKNIFISVVLLLISCGCYDYFLASTSMIDQYIFKDKGKLKFPKEYIARHFDFPVGKPDAKGYYNAQKFGKRFHLGEDWNGVGGGNTDLGDPVYAIANGYVKFAKDIELDWGNVIRVIHELDDGQQVESLYAHCDTILVKKGDWIKKGQQIGTIGNLDGAYKAHLHLEMRYNIHKGIGRGYSSDTSGYLVPTEFIKAHR